ncbi:MAG TPA: glucans biosynthesis glucosyltransferase MdoH [Rhodopila sp.]|nr:glucans biosynthesis glucosyltransferase MdoH [Rhodopila sp.]
MHLSSKAEMILPVTPSVLRRRRLGFASVTLLTWAGFLFLLARALGPSWLTAVLVACAAVFLPWSVLGLWNGVIGLALLRHRPPPCPGGPVTLRTAIVMTLRNENPDRAVARLRIIADSLRAAAVDGFAFFLLSDTDIPRIAMREAAAVAAWRLASCHPERIHYRRRTRNTGFKAGNIMDFCRTQAAGFDLMLPLDADSLMSGPAILHLVRLMQSHPRIGIIQGLVTGLPATSAFTRIFQFGMRAGMRSYTLGQAWWTGDCGPFWGHNAIIRIAPFRDHCALPILPGRPPLGGTILSHDQVEAALMRRAGWEVRLQPVAGGSYEDNPPTLIDYVRRDLRWCHGNLQYLRLLALPGLYPVSRFQLVWAVLMFIGLPAWTVMIALLPAAGAVISPPHPGWLAVLYALFLLMDVAAKLAGYLHSAVAPRRVARYGGRTRFLAGAAVEIVFAWLKSSITAFRATIFILALMTGHATAWTAQQRDARTVSWREAARMFWPETAFGAVFHAALWLAAPHLVPWALPFTTGYVLAIPFAVTTAHPALGRWCTRLGLCAIPEEIRPPAEIVAVTAEQPPHGAPHPDVSAPQPRTQSSCL